MYQLGLCHFLLGQFGESRTVFDRYLDRFRRYPRAQELMVYYGDSFRFENKLQEAVAKYREALQFYKYDRDWLTDIYAAIAKCFLAEDDWEAAMPELGRAFRTAPDSARRSWAASLLTVGYLEQDDLDRVFNIMEVLLTPDSFAGRSVVLNLAAVSNGDLLFADERYREALWVYRIVYPRNQLQRNAERYLGRLERRAEFLKRRPGRLRELIRVQENISQVSQELEALKEVDNYDDDLEYRIARSYMETRRYFESYELFLSLYQRDIPERAEECLYLAFSSAVQVEPFDRALFSGHEYMEVYPGGEWYDPISLQLGQVHARLKQWPEVIETLSTALEISPEHEDVVECMYLLGYACFMEERFTESVKWLVTMNEEYPGNLREADGEYWAGMARMFDRQYEEALPHFDRVLDEFPDCIYVEDAEFRSASCTFGLSEWDEAEQKLLSFLYRYPESVLGGEAFTMLGDISAVYGRLPEAVDRYQQALAYTLNIEQYNYVQFRRGEILAELNRYEEVVEHFQAYIKDGREGSNLALAVYWMGEAYWQMDRRDRALEFYLSAIKRFGRDRTAVGIDLVVNEWIGRVKSLESGEADLQRQELQLLLNEASAENERTLVIRLARALIYAPGQSEEGRETMKSILLNSNSVQYASPGSLEFMLKLAQERGRSDLAEQVARRMVEDFPETDSVLPARSYLADLALAAGDTETAVEHLEVIRSVFASSDMAADALLTLGRIYRDQERYEDAHEAYNDVLAAREWRTRRPEALYGRGLTHIADREYEQATALFERIYVMYFGHAEWTAKAYVRRAEALIRLRQYRKALATLNEMLTRDGLEDQPEITRARELVQQLEDRFS